MFIICRYFIFRQVPNLISGLLLLFLAFSAQAISYLALKLFLFPAIWISGILYLLYSFWGGATSGDALMWVAVIHTIFAFAIAAFIIIHVYLLTTGHSFKEHVMPMINGFDEVELSEAEEAYLEKDEPGHIE